jgi:hypothetical protein
MTRRDDDMDDAALSPSELEAEADRLRDEIGSDVERLKGRLTPSWLLGEWVEESGAGALDLLEIAMRRHPLPTVLIGFGLGMLLRKAASRDGRSRVELDLSAVDLARASQAAREETRALLSDLSATATASLSAQVEQRREEVVDAMKDHATALTTKLGSAIEKQVGKAVSGSGIPVEARSLLTRALQLFVLAGAEGALAGIDQRLRRRRKSDPQPASAPYLYP